MYKNCSTTPESLSSCFFPSLVCSHLLPLLGEFFIDLPLCSLRFNSPCCPLLLLSPRINVPAPLPTNWHPRHFPDAADELSRLGTNICIASESAPATKSKTKSVSFAFFPGPLC